MIDIIVKLVPSTLSAALAAGLVIAVFRYLNATVNERLRESVSYWILGEVPALNWREQASNLIDKFFGTHHFSWKCFVRSCLVSYILSFLIFTSINSLFSHYATGRSIYEPKGENLGDPRVWVVLFYTVTLISLLPDYFSLLKTRVLLRIAARTHRRTIILLLVLIDLCLSALLITLSLKLFATYWEALDQFGSFFQFINNQIADHFFVYLVYILPIFLSAFLPSMWLYLYLISGVAVKVAFKFSKGVARLSPWLSIERIDKDPLNLIGECAGAITFAAVCLLGYLV